MFIDSEYMSLEEQRARYKAAQERMHKAGTKRIETDAARAELQEELKAAKAKMQQQQELIDTLQQEKRLRHAKEEAQKIISDKRLRKEKVLDKVNADALNNVERLNHIMRLVAFVTDMTVDDLSSHHRGNDYVKARHIAMWLAMQNTTLSLTRIGRKFNRDHTTVLYAHRKVDIVMSHIGWPEASMKEEAKHLWKSDWPSVSKEVLREHAI